MTEWKRVWLLQYLNTAAQFLQGELIRRTGIIEVPFFQGERTEFRGPPLLVKAVLNDLDMTTLVLILYGDANTLRDRLMDVWAQAARMIVHDAPAKDLVRLFSEVYPDMPFRGCPRAVAAQFLYLAGHDLDRKVYVTRKGVEFGYGGDVGLDGPRVMWQRSMRHAGGEIPRDYLKLLREPLGPLRTSSRETSGLARALRERLPDLAPQIDLLLSITVHAGREYEEEIWSKFDMVPQDPDDVRSIEETCKICRDIVDRAETTPLDQLLELLRPHIGSVGFRKHFGNSSAVPGYYSYALRQRHRELLDKLASGEIKCTDLVVLTGQRSEEARSLLNLQQMIGRI